jgi:hypothetical protein
VHTMKAQRRTRDSDLRAALVSRLETSSAPGRILHEVWVPLSKERADVVEVNGRLAAFELKSGSDDLSRLERQLTAFSHIFEQVTIVCDPRHMDNVDTMAPRWCGLIQADFSQEGVAFKSSRQARPNPELDPAWQLRLLWREELEPAVKALGLKPMPKYHCDLRAAILKEYKREQIAALVRDRLRVRDLSRKRF